MQEIFSIEWSLAILLEDELAGVLTYGRQQLRFYIQLSYYHFFY